MEAGQSGVCPDRFGIVRNVEFFVKSAQVGSSIYEPSWGQLIRIHVSNLLLLVPEEDQDASETKACVVRADDKTEDHAVGAGKDAELPGEATSREDDEENGAKVPM